MTLGSELDWGFVAEPKPRLNGRAIAYSMGKVLGGGSSINVSTWSRGHRAGLDFYTAEVEQTMQHVKDERTARNRATARDIHEVTYLKHITGASEADIRNAIEKVGRDRDKLERELKRSKVRDW